MTKPIVERHELSLYGIKTIMRHDYADPEIMGKIRSYIDKSIKALDDFLTNVPGSEKFKSFCDVGCGEDYVVEKMSKKFSEFFGA